MNTISRVAIGWGVIWSVLVIGGCSASSGEPCVRDSDCQPGYECASTGGVAFGERLCLISASAVSDTGHETGGIDADTGPAGDTGSSGDTGPSDDAAFDGDATVDVSDAVDSADAADTADTTDGSDGGLQSVTLTSQSGSNSVDDDLLLSVSSGSAVAGLITDWQINNESLTQLFLPLDYTDGAEAPVYGGSQATCELGTGSATPTVGPGVIADAYRFDGVDDRVLCTGTFQYDRPFSLEVWLKPDLAQEGSGNAGIVSAVLDDRSDWNWQIRYGSPNLGRLGWNLSVGSDQSMWISVGTDLSVDEWHHVVATYDGVTATLYLDGVKTGATGIPLADTAVSAVQLGSDGWSNYFDGSLDGVRIYRRALSDDQVAAFYQAGASLQRRPTDGRTLVAAETTAGDAVKACVTPHDGQSDGPAVCSNTIVTLDVQ